MILSIRALAQTSPSRRILASRAARSMEFVKASQMRAIRSGAIY
jgi:hypothetical protein